MNNKVLVGILGILVVMALVVLYIQAPDVRSQNLPGVLQAEKGLHYGDIIVVKSAYWRNFISGRGGDNTDTELMKNVGEWEEWQILKASNQDNRGEVKFNDTVLLKSVYWDNYLSGRGSGDEANVQLMKEPGDWEKFKILNPDNPDSTETVKPGAVAIFECENWGNYLSARGKEDSSKVQLMNDPLGWERWLVMPKGYVKPTFTSAEIHYGDNINLQSGFFHNYLSGRSGKDNKDVKLIKNLGPWEDWELVDPDRPGYDGVVNYNDTVMFYSLSWDNYLSGRGDGDKIGVQVMGVPGPWEKWIIINPADPKSTAPVKTSDIILVKSVDWGSYLSARGSRDEAKVELMTSSGEWERWHLTKKEYLRNWMSSTPEIMDKRLQEITFPASHDSGTATFLNKIVPSQEAKIMEELLPSVESLFKGNDVIKITGGSVTLDDIKLDIINELTLNAIYDIIKDLARCTEFDIGTQLDQGIRWLDLRIYTESSNTAYTHHTLIGMDMATILNQVQQFLTSTKGEIVVLEMSHFEGGYTQDFLDKVKETLGAYAYTKQFDAQGNVTNNPLDQTYREVVGSSSKVILLTSEDTSSDPMLWHYDQLGIRNESKEGKPWYSYADQTDAEAMYNNQAEKYLNAKAADHPYTLWYTLTAQQEDITKIVLGRLPEVLADALAPQVVDWVLGRPENIVQEYAHEAAVKLLRGQLKNLVKDKLSVETPPYESVKELSQRVNPNLKTVLENKFQSSTTGNNFITVLYIDFFEDTSLVELAISYSRLPAIK